jgi:imidazolonepropionase-like amidohydrolase
MSKTLIVRNGSLIDGSGRPPSRNDAIVIEGNRIKSVGALPPDVALEDRRSVDVIDAGGQWIMPGLIDAHCHVSYGYPVIKGEGKRRGTNAYAVGLEGQVGELAPGKLADLIVLNKDPIADITVLQGGKHLSWVIKDGKIIDLDRRNDVLTFQQAAE